MEACLFVAAGGALGAVGRYLLGLVPLSGSFPLMTLLINFGGAVLIGFVTSAPGMSGSAMLFLKTGVCGGFTTFSTFSLDTVKLLQDGKLGLGALNMGASVGICLLGVLLGQCLGRAFAARA